MSWLEILEVSPAEQEAITKKMREQVSLVYDLFLKSNIATSSYNTGVDEQVSLVSLVLKEKNIKYKDLTINERELFEERAAIMEFDSGMFREEAEIQVLEDIRNMRVREHVTKVNTSKIAH
jgi:hypothetical protein